MEDNYEMKEEKNDVEIPEKHEEHQHQEKL